MSYWSGAPQDSDFAFGAVGVIVLQTVKRLESEADLVLEKQHPEQSMLALLHVLEGILDQFPKCVSVHFGKKRYLTVKEKYLRWRASCARIPMEYAAEVDESAQALFERLDAKLKGV